MQNVARGDCHDGFNGYHPAGRKQDIFSHRVKDAALTAIRGWAQNGGGSSGGSGPPASAEVLVRLFVQEPDVVRYGADCLRIVSTSYVFWAFGMITITEMLMTEILRSHYADRSWQELLSEGRLGQARALQQERARRGQQVDLVDCLQFGDKGWILTYNEELRKNLGLNTRREARNRVKEIENLRNNLAHTQEIIPTGWPQIIITCSNWEKRLENLVTGLPAILGNTSQ